MRPVVYGLELRYGDQINFTYFEVADPATDEFKRQLGLAGTPHFFLLDPDGVVLGEWVGVVPARVLEAAIQGALGS